MSNTSLVAGIFGTILGLAMTVFVLMILYVVAGGTLPGGFSAAHPCGPSKAYVNGHCQP